MQTAPPTSQRELHTVRLAADIVIVGGGMAGVCCAITAARAGIKVVLVQDRPVLGGNASSEVRLWILGATSHMGNNNRWAREGGVIDEILVENVYRNPEGNPLLVDILLLEKVVVEPNITLLLNTAVYEVSKLDADTIGSVRAFCSQNSTIYELSAPLFCDASGDGVVGFMAGAAFRMGAESTSEFGEKFAPRDGNGELLGHSLYFYSKDAGRPVKFTPPAFALTDIREIPRWRNFSTREHGCQLWWIEHGGRLDTVHDTETIKWELWRIIYGVWNHIKNSGEFPEAENLTLEWVGTIPGKRESRRFEGDYILRQQDIVEQRAHADAVAFGGWAIDLHPADGVFSEKPGCTQWHAKGIYPIPYRCLYSRNIRNLMLAGRIISASHVAFASTRVMATCAHIGQAVGMAAALCRRHGILPRELTARERMDELQQLLLRAGQHLPDLALRDPADLVAQAEIEASSELRISELPPDGPLLGLENGWAMLLPVQRGTRIGLTVMAEVAAAAELRVELRQSSRLGNHTPDVTLETQVIALHPRDEGGHAPAALLSVAASNGAGASTVLAEPEKIAPARAAVQEIAIEFAHTFSDSRYAFVCFFGGSNIRMRCSRQRVTGVLSLCHQVNLAVATSPVQTPPEDIGVDSFEFWQPRRRPAGHNLALRIDPPLGGFGASNVVNGITRPTRQPNAWVAAFDDPRPTLILRWPAAQTIARIELMFDTDFDHPMESVLMGHPERRMPLCVERYRVLGEDGSVLAQCDDNHQTHNIIVLPRPVQTRSLRIELTAPSPEVPAALFAVRCYGTAKPELP